MTPADPALETPLSRRFGPRLPVVAGGLMRLKGTDDCAAAAPAGLPPFVTATSERDRALTMSSVRNAIRTLGTEMTAIVDRRERETPRSRSRN